MKNQKGITLMLLVTTVVMMGLIFGAITYNSLNSYRLNSYYLMCSDIELLEEKIALYYIENKTLPILDNSIQITTLLGSDNYVEGSPNYNPNNSGILYKIDFTKLQNLSLRRTEYYIDSVSHTIYATNGQKIGDDILYTIPQDYTKVNLSLYQ